MEKLNKEIDEIIEWASDFDCEGFNGGECFNRSMETDGGEEMCIPCKAKAILQKNIK